MDFGSLMGGFSGLIVVVTTIPFLLIGLALIFWGMRSRKSGNETKSWPITMGRVLSAEVESRRSSTSNNGGYSTNFYPQVIYEYDFGGQRYQSNQITRGFQVGYGMVSVAQQKTLHYPAGSHVQVHYNPANPSDAVLETGSHGGSKIVVGIGIAIFLFSACMGLSMTVFSTFFAQFINQVTNAVTK